MNRLLFPALALVLAACLPAGARAAEPFPLDATSADEFHRQADELRREMAEGRQVREPVGRAAQARRLPAGCAGQALRQARDAEKFTRKDEVALVNASEEINAVLSGKDDDRLICEQRRAIGSNRMQKVCMTVGERASAATRRGRTCGIAPAGAKQGQLIRTAVGARSVQSRQRPRAGAVKGVRNDAGQEPRTAKAHRGGTGDPQHLVGTRSVHRPRCPRDALSRRRHRLHDGAEDAADHACEGPGRARRLAARPRLQPGDQQGVDAEALPHRFRPARVDGSPSQLVLRALGGGSNASRAELEEIRALLDRIESRIDR